jgi:hypothetical protein
MRLKCLNSPDEGEKEKNIKIAIQTQNKKANKNPRGKDSEGKDISRI